MRYASFLQYKSNLMTGLILLCFDLLCKKTDSEFHSHFHLYGSTAINNRDICGPAQAQHDWIFCVFSQSNMSLREIKHLSGLLTVHTEASSSFIKSAFPADSSTEDVSTGFYVFTLITRLGIGISVDVRFRVFHKHVNTHRRKKRAGVLTLIRSRRFH